MWEIALSRILGAAPPARRSCCLMYALPGLTACAGCPRQA
nr:(2Fe-2S)-binding protein [Janibacter cremeus]